MEYMFQRSPTSPSPPPASSRYNKATVQKEYRKEEGDSFNGLRDAIKRLTGEEPRTRLEILRKAIELLSAMSSSKDRSNAQATLAMYDIPTATPSSAPLAYPDSSFHTQSFQWPPHRQSDAMLNAPTFSPGGYYPSHQHQHHLAMPHIGSQTLNRPGRSGYTGSSFSDPSQLWRGL